MSEELIQRNLPNAPEKMGDWNFYNIGSTTLKALKGAKIIPNRDYDEYETKRPDALIVKASQVIAVVEYKQSKELRTDKQIEAAIAQEIGTAQALGAKVYIVTDGKKTFWINPLTQNQIKFENGCCVSLLFDKGNVDCIKLINKIIASVSADNDIITEAAVVDPLPLAQKIWQDLWSVSGATPENCLYTFVEVFIFKYLSDLGVLTGLYSFDHLLRQYKTNNDNEVIEYYASTVRVKIKELFPGNPKDKTTIINGTIFVSKDDRAVAGYATVFKKILYRFNDFGSLENIDYDFKSKLFETFLKESISKKNWGQFFTPLKVVRSIVSMADVRAGMSVCDPACGVGKFLLEPVLHNLHRYFKVENGQLKSQITLSGFDKGFDKDEQKTIILAKANMLIYFSGLLKEHSNITQQFARLFNDTFLLQTNSILGTLINPVTDKYDLILTNPPYVMSGSSNLKEEIAKQEELKEYYTISAMGIEGLFMEWIIRALKPGGKAFVVVPDGIMNRNNDRRLRDFILDECDLDAVISLPLNTFFTTNKKTYIMVLTKKVPVTVGGISEKRRQVSPVFTYLCSEIGETRDVYRFNIDQNDLDAAAMLYNMFKGIQGHFSTNDKRCKIVDIDRFYDEDHWSVERWWTREEKIQLGIEKRVDTVSIEDYASMVSDAADSLTEIYNELKDIQQANVDLGVKKNKSSRLIKVSEAFFISRGSGKYTKAYAQQHKGDFPVYSGNTVNAFATIDSFDYNSPSLSWVIDGLAGYIMYHDVPFSATNHRGILLPKSENIDLHYAKLALEPLFREAKKGRLGSKGQNEYTSLPPFMVQDLKFEIPVDENGKYDLGTQKDYSVLHSRLADCMEAISRHKEDLENASIALDINHYDTVYFQLNKILTPIKGVSKYTKKYGNLHKGPYPVYSASSHTPLTYIDSFDYDGTYLTWSTNGFAGTTLVLNGKFSINGDRGILVPQNNRRDISIQYLKYILEPILRGLAKGRRGDKGQDEFTKLYPSMLSSVMIPFPVDSQGNISFRYQQEVAQKYAALEQDKSLISDVLNTLLEQKICF